MTKIELEAKALEIVKSKSLGMLIPENNTMNRYEYTFVMREIDKEIKGINKIWLLGITEEVIDWAQAQYLSINGIEKFS